MGSWDSAWKAPKEEKLLVGGREVRWLYRVVRDAPHYVSLAAYIDEDELKRLGVGKGEGWGGVDVDSVSRESKQIDARGVRESDIYGMLRSKMKRLDKYLTSGLTTRRLAAIMKAQGLEPVASLVARRR